MTENTERLTAQYGAYTVSYLPYDLLQELFEDDVNTCDWDARKIVAKVDQKIKKNCSYDADKGLQLDRASRVIYIQHSQRRLRTLFYYLVTGIYTNGRYSLRFPEDNYLTMEPERMTVVDRKELSRKAGAERIEMLKKAKELLGDCDE